MSEPTPRAEISLKTAVLRIPGMDAVTVRSDVAYRQTETGPLVMDLYYPPDAKTAAPAMIIVVGYPDPGVQKVFGCRFKEMGMSVSWGQLAAASGIVTVTYTNREPAADLAALLDHLRANAGELGIDASRLALWAGSGNVPLALGTLMRPEVRDFMKCAVLCYGLTLDLDGGTVVADSAKTFGFANAGAGKSVQDLPPEVPLFVARAGQDQIPGLNAALDRFIAGGLACNLPLTVVNHPTGPHAFDLLDDSETTREVIRQILRFLQFRLGVAFA